MAFDLHVLIPDHCLSIHSTKHLFICYMGFFPSKTAKNLDPSCRQDLDFEIVLTGEKISYSRINQCSR